jgi:hypothetical protein
VAVGVLVGVALGVFVGVGLLGTQGAVPQSTPLAQVPVVPHAVLQADWLFTWSVHDPLGQRQQPSAAAAVFGALNSAPKLRTTENKATATILRAVPRGLTHTSGTSAGSAICFGMLSPFRAACTLQI